MKKLVVLAVTAMFAFAVSAQTQAPTQPDKAPKTEVKKDAAPAKDAAAAPAKKAAAPKKDAAKKDGMKKEAAPKKDAAPKMEEKK